jgi:hypothetical protein
MYEFDFSTLSAILGSFFKVVGGVLRFDETAIEAIYHQGGGNWIALAILILGGTSLAIGQSVVLFANRVNRRRFVLSITLSGLVFLLWVLLWAGSTWLLMLVVHGQDLSYTEILLGAAISMAPLLFGFLVLLPYIGNPIFQLLRIWILLIFLVVISVETEANYLGALALAALGWLLIEVVLRFPPLQFQRLRNWGWQKVTGTPYRLDVDEVSQQFVDRVHTILEKEGESSSQEQVK